MNRRHPIANSHCPICGDPINVHQRVRSGTCDRPACRHERLRRQIQIKQEEEKKLRDKAIGLCHERAIADGLATQEIQMLAILPANERLMVNVPKRRLRSFRDRLMGIISTAAAKLAGPERDAPHNDDEQIAAPTVDSPQLQKLLANGCATCRGDCCQQGGDHAFLHLETICRYMQQHPGQRPRHVLEAYLSYIGEKSYQNACLYQGSEGCRLPRNMRSRICNDYLCQGLIQLLENAKGQNNPRAYAVATLEGEIRRAALIDSDSVRMLKS